jgi:hypothetical protein
MIDAPDRIWAGNDGNANRWDWEEPVTGWEEYIHADVADARIEAKDARIEELEAMLTILATPDTAERRMNEMEASDPNPDDGSIEVGRSSLRWNYLEATPAKDAPVVDNPSGMYCPSCRATGLSHCAQPEWCGGMLLMQLKEK